jgi:hypothetical protein
VVVIERETAVGKGKEMAKDGENTMMPILLIGGAALAYWYITNNGPSGAVYNAQGQKVAPSYWDTWFGGATTPTATAPAIAAPPPAGVTPTTTTQPASPGAAAGTPSSTSVSQATRAALLNSAAAAGLAANNVTADQWAYFYANLPGKQPIPVNTYAGLVAALGITKPCPIPGSTADTCSWSVVSVDQFLGALANAGLSGFGDIIPTRLPMMTIKGKAGARMHKGWVQ